MTIETITISEDDDGQRLDRWLKKNASDLPYVAIQKLLRKGQIRVNGKRAVGDARLKSGDLVRVPMGSKPPEVASRSTGRKDSAWLRQFLLFEDDDILAFNKPPGLAVQGGSGLTLHLEMLMDDFVRRGVAPRLVHRLDRDTSGVLVLARSARAARRLTEQFSARETEKIYWALVSPMPRYDKGVITARLEKIQEGKQIEKIAVVDGLNGQEAETEYRVLARAVDHNVAWVEFMPRTGRTHQIRVHAAHIGAPLLGDPKYGGDADKAKAVGGADRVHLHAAQLTLTHPRSGKSMTIQAPLPDDLVLSWRGFGFRASKE